MSRYTPFVRNDSANVELILDDAYAVLSILTGTSIDDVYSF